MPVDRKISILILLSLSLLSFISCNRPENTPIKIGFIGTLTGHAAVVGDACRDAVVLAVEQFNQSGGLNGRKVELVIEDIKQNNEIAQTVVKKFKEQKIPVVVGPMFSSMALAVAETAPEDGPLFISPTASTTALNDRDDYLLRLYPPSNVAAKRMADHIADKSLMTISIILDTNNSAFTEDWKNYFVTEYLARGGKILDSVSYRHEDVSYKDLVSSLVPRKPSAILILSNAIETAMFCQQLRIHNQSVPVFASEWSMTEGLIQMGGKSVEGVEFFHVLDASSSAQRYLDFLAAFQKRYMTTPSYPAILAYDAITIALKGLELGARTGTEFKNVLLKQKTLNTLQTTIRFDSYGEVERNLFLNRVQNGMIVSAEKQ